MCWYILCLSGNILSQGVWVALWSLINGSREKLSWGIKGQGLRIWWILLDLKDIFKLKWPVVHFFHSYFWQKMGNDLRSCVRLATRLSSLSFVNVQIPFNIEWRKLYGNRSFFLVYIASELFSEHIFTSTIRYQRKVPELNAFLIFFLYRNVSPLVSLAEWQNQDDPYWFWGQSHRTLVFENGFQTILQLV